MFLWYRNIAVQLTNLVLFVVLINIILAIYFAASETSQKASPGFSNDGRPNNDGQKTPYQLTWFDATALPKK